ncbi:hypothetical protein AVEN_273458-1 [Araneus ventricosus]|uniref:Uncharacterized protein n=1 Tax=Araneus ventricosus TaxID=182803 RepID=A0A4Y2X9L2_ARAVE|nr:hypothetical protein AVEN_273458-1 [Araneus ventricosus]
MYYTLNTTSDTCLLKSDMSHISKQFLSHIFVANSKLNEASPVLNTDPDFVGGLKNSRNLNSS